MFLSHLCFLSSSCLGLRSFSVNGPILHCLSQITLSIMVNLYLFIESKQYCYCWCVFPDTKSVFILNILIYTKHYTILYYTIQHSNSNEHLSLTSPPKILRRNISKKTPSLFYIIMIYATNLSYAGNHRRCFIFTWVLSCQNSTDCVQFSLLSDESTET